jgi:hypothetical protein
VLINCESVFEDATKHRFEVWVTKSIPDWQFGFVSKHGTLDYGVALSITLPDCLERRSQGILIATDVKGTFDRCRLLWMLNRLRAKGMRGRALKLIRDYLYRRFIAVVAARLSSSKRQIFSGVPQGGKRSSFL